MVFRFGNMDLGFVTAVGGSPTNFDIDIGRGTEITLPEKVSSILGFDITNNKLIDKEILPWWNKGSTSLNIEGALQDLNAGDIVSSFSPSSSNFAIEWDGTHYWIIDGLPAPHEIKSYTPAGSVVSSFVTGSTQDSEFGIAWDGNNLWISMGNADDKVIEITTTGTIISSFALPFTTSNPGGMAWDGESLWTVAVQGDTMYELSRTGTTLQTWATGNTTSTGVTWDGVNLWTMDQNDQQIKEMTRAGTAVSSFTYAFFENKNDLAWDGKRLRVQENSRSKLIKDGRRNVKLVMVGVS